VDVLLLGDREHRSARLTLPHAEVMSRRFVLEPLLELAPDQTLPDGTRLAQGLAAVTDQPVERFAAPPAWGV
jgi:2-amino-4-hydroxy-6-hydroxymethyldihydropteridine diphosphokinase